MDTYAQKFDTSLDDVVGQVIVTENVTREQVENLLTTAFDTDYGGCWYWIEQYTACFGDKSGTTGKQLGLDYFYECLTRDGHIHIKPEDYSDQDDWFDLTLAKFIEGIQMHCAARGKTFDAMYENHDAEDADCIIQRSLFGQIIFG